MQSQKDCCQIFKTHTHTHTHTHSLSLSLSLYLSQTHTHTLSPSLYIYISNAHTLSTSLYTISLRIHTKPLAEDCCQILFQSYKENCANAYYWKVRERVCVASERMECVSKWVKNECVCMCVSVIVMEPFQFWVFSSAEPEASTNNKPIIFPFLELLPTQSQPPKFQFMNSQAKFQKSFSHFSLYASECIKLW